MKKQKLLMNKKGELTTKQLVTIIILIVSFIVILFLIFRLNLGETSDKEICRNSVILKGQSKLSTGPLDCRTNYLCISGSGECEAISQTSETEVDADNETQIMKALADEMSDCWFQFGEGEVNYGSVSPSEFGIEYALCSIVSFDESIQNNNLELTYQKLYDYMRTTQKSNPQTYLQYLYGTNTLDGIDDVGYVEFDLSESINTGERYSIITGIDNNPTPQNDVILKVYIIPTDETNSRLDSGKFITKP